MIITFANHKGGVGKSTLAVIATQTLLDNNAIVTMYDLDGQQNYTDAMQNWTQGVVKKFEIVTKSKLPEKITDSGYTIIDTPPGLGIDTEQAIAIADVVVVPVETAISSIKGLNDILRVKAKNKVVIVLNKYDKNTAFARDFARQLKEMTKKIGSRVTLHVISTSRQLICNINTGNYWAYRMTDQTATPYLQLIKDIIKKERN